MYNYNEAEKKERRKIISVATAAAVLILVLVVAIIVVATRKTPTPNVAGNDNGSFEIDENLEDEKEEEPEKQDTEEAKPSAVGPISTDTTPELEPVEPAQTPSAVPQTGPADALPLALLLGAATVFISSAILKKQESLLEIKR